MIEGFEHVALEVQDAERSSRFYSEMFGAKVTDHWESKVPDIRRIVFIELGGVTVELIERGGPKARSSDQGDAGIKHLCLRVTGLDTEMARIERMGAKVVQGIIAIDLDRFEPLVANGSMDLAKGMRRAVVSDPDGILIELMEK